MAFMPVICAGAASRRPLALNDTTKCESSHRTVIPFKSNSVSETANGAWTSVARQIDLKLTLGKWGGHNSQGEANPARSSSGRILL
eukprot:5234843-Amphidinium_carterae.1